MTPRIIIHSRAHAEAAAIAAAALGIDMILMSAPGAGLFAGPAWFKAVLGGAKGVLDCGEAAG
ncbi:MAG TPA: hypothetical protein VKT70_05535, partial [Stellaceae bacterium]|nr:hypothetical protein [Stellaceae bacterium]